MDVSLGGLTAELRANIHPLRKDADQALQILNNYANRVTSRMARLRATIATLSGGIKSVFSDMKTGMAMLLGFLGARKLLGFMKDSLASVDALGKLSDNIGISTEALIALNHAAVLNGVGISELNQSLIRMSSQLGKAVDGTSPLAVRLRAMGTNAQDFIKMKPEQQMYAFADAIQAASSQAEKMAIADDFLGRGGRRLVVLFQGGSKALKEYEAEAARLGLTLSRFDAKMIEEANDAMYRVQRVLGAISDKLTIKMAPAITAVATRLTEFFAEFATSEEKLGKFARNMGRYMVFVADAVMIATLAFKVFETGLRAVEYMGAKTLSGLGSAIQTTMKFLKEALESSVQSFNDGIWFMYTNLGSYSTKIVNTLVEKVVAGYNKVADKIFFMSQIEMPQMEPFKPFDRPDWMTGWKADPQPEAVERLKFIADYAEASGKGLDEAAAAVEKLFAGLSAGGTTWGDMLQAQLALLEKNTEAVRNTMETAAQNATATEAADAVNAKLEDLLRNLQTEYDMIGKSALQQRILQTARQNQIEEGTAGYKALADAITRVHEKETSWQSGAKTYWAQYLDNVRNGAKQIEELMSTAFKGVEDALVDFVKTGKMSLKELGLQLAEMMVRMAIQRGIAAAFGGGFANGGVFQGGRAQKFANGGVVSSPTLFPMSGGKAGLMGEAGPEAIMPLKRTASGELGVSVDDRGGSKGSVSIVQNFHFDKGVNEISRATILEMMPELAEMSSAKIKDDLYREGITL